VLVTRDARVSSDGGVWWQAEVVDRQMPSARVWNAFVDATMPIPCPFALRRYRVHFIGYFVVSGGELDSRISL
jgi:hypothetical protein